MTEPITEFRGKYRFLSNFWGSPITGKDGRVYPTVEHAFQAAKYPVDSEAHEKVRCAATAGEAKRLGRTLGAHRPDWNEIRLRVMWRLVSLKFASGSTLAGKLLETGDADIIEGNTWGDVFWGTCGGKGENHLGKMLMRVRAQLREQCS